jgi:hypothetical protein
MKLFQNARHILALFPAAGEERVWRFNPMPLVHHCAAFVRRYRDEFV